MPKPATLVQRARIDALTAALGPRAHVFDQVPGSRKLVKVGGQGDEVIIEADVPYHVGGDIAFTVKVKPPTERVLAAALLVAGFLTVHPAAGGPPQGWAGRGAGLWKLTGEVGDLFPAELSRVTQGPGQGCVIAGQHGDPVRVQVEVPHHHYRLDVPFLVRVQPELAPEFAALVSDFRALHVPTTRR